MTSALILCGLVAVALFLTAGAFGFCHWCEQWAENEWGYMADVEHGSDGRPLTGWRLQSSRIIEGFIGTPLCWPVNKLLGRLRGPAKLGWPFGKAKDAD